MRFIGIDLAWGARNTSALVALELHASEDRNALQVFAFADALLTDDAILEFVGSNDDGKGIVLGIDAPLDVPNETGERPVEAILRRCFGKYQAGAHPANRNLYKGDIRGERLVRRLEAEHAICNDFEFAPRDPSVRRCLEVFPHPAHVVLFELERTLKYKSKPGRDYAFRMQEFARLVAGIQSLALADPVLVSPNWLVPPNGKIGSALKRYEDLLDALMCAYVAAYFWVWGDSDRCTVLGDQTSGYVITPITSTLRSCLQTHVVPSN